MVLSNRRIQRAAIALIVSLGLMMAVVLLAPEPADASIVPGTHKCVATTPVQGYRGVHCADLDLQGSFMWARGQSLCQRVSDAAEVQCAGLKMYVHVEDITFYPDPPETGPTRTVVCGRFTTPDWHDPPCPSSGRFEAFSFGLPLICGHRYRAHVYTQFVLPVSAEYQTASIDSNSYVYQPAGC